MPRSLCNNVIIATIIATLAAGCASSKDSTPPEKKDDAELKAARVEVEDAQKRQHDAEAKLEDSRRELERVKKELAASRETRSATDSEARLSQDLLVKQRKDYEAKIAFYKDLLAKSGKPAANDGAAPDDAAIASATAPEPVTIKKGALDPDQPVATIDGDAIPRRDFMEWLYCSQGPSALDPFLDTVLAAREAKREGIEVSDADVETFALKKLALIVQQNGGDKALDDKLAQSNMTKEMLLDVLRVNARTLVALEKLCLADRNTKEWKERLEEKAHQAFELSFGEKVTAKHFFIHVPETAPEEDWKSALEVAKATRQRLVLGEDWSKVAREMATSAHVKAQADTNTYSHAHFAQWPELDKLFFGSTDGEVSEPLRWKGGVSIVQVDKRSAQSAKFEERRQSIIEDLVKPEVSEDEIKAVTARLRANAKIEKKLELR